MKEDQDWVKEDQDWTRDWVQEQGEASRGSCLHCGRNNTKTLRCAVGT